MGLDLDHVLVQDLVAQTDSFFQSTFIRQSSRLVKQSPFLSSSGLSSIPHGIGFRVHRRRLMGGDGGNISATSERGIFLCMVSPFEPDPGPGCYRFLR